MTSMRPNRPRELMTGRKRDDQIAINERQRAARHDQAAIRAARECLDAPLDLAGARAR